MKKDLTIKNVALFWTTRGEFITNSFSNVKNNSSISTEINVDVITNYKEVVNKDFSKYDLFLILAELDWKIYQPSDLFGIDLLKDLRLKKGSVTSIILASFLSIDQIKLLRANKDLGIIEPSQLNFMHLPLTNPIEIDSLKKRMLNKFNNALNILFYFFELDTYYSKSKDHQNSLFGDIHKVNEIGLTKNQNYWDMLAYIESRIGLIIKCWNEIEMSGQKAKFFYHNEIGDLINELDSLEPDSTENINLVKQIHYLVKEIK